MTRDVKEVHTAELTSKGFERHKAEKEEGNLVLLSSRETDRKEHLWFCGIPLV